MSPKKQREVTFDVWCVIAAETSGREREELLDRLDREDLSVEAWTDANERHLRAIAVGLERGDRRLAERYSARCLEVRKRGPGAEESGAAAAEERALHETVVGDEDAPAQSVPFVRGAGTGTVPAGLPVQEQSGETVAMENPLAADDDTP